jgi:uncharacterized protein (DUF433 family)
MLWFIVAFCQFAGDAVMGGRACIRGMRMTVSLAVNLMANGMYTEDIVREYPELGADADV